MNITFSVCRESENLSRELKPYDKNFGALSHWLTSNGWRGVTPKRGSILIIYDNKTGNEVKRL